jgi:hypothetical protein
MVRHSAAEEHRRTIIRSHAVRLAVIPGRVEDANPESRAKTSRFPDAQLRI